MSIEIVSENALPSFDYEVTCPEIDVTASAVFRLVTQPNDHTLCGDPANVNSLVTYTQQFGDGSIPVTSSSRPLSWEENAAYTFTVFSDDFSLVSSGPDYNYQLFAQLTAWPASDTVVSTGTITFINPCINLDTFEATAQDDVDGDDYSG